jgi:hypothetical protein
MNVFNWIINQISHKQNAYSEHDSITYLAYDDIMGHGPASSQSNNTEEAVRKTLLMIQTAFRNSYL